MAKLRRDPSQFRPPQGATPSFPLLFMAQACPSTPKKYSPRDDPGLPCWPTPNVRATTTSHAICTQFGLADRHTPDRLLGTTIKGAAFRLSWAEADGSQHECAVDKPATLLTRGGSSHRSQSVGTRLSCVEHVHPISRSYGGEGLWGNPVPVPVRRGPAAGVLWRTVRNGDGARAGGVAGFVGTASGISGLGCTLAALFVFPRIVHEKVRTGTRSATFWDRRWKSRWIVIAAGVSLSAVTLVAGVAPNT